jgi:hypothetical protein
MENSFSIDEIDTSPSFNYVLMEFVEIEIFVDFDLEIRENPIFGISLQFQPHIMTNWRYCE